MGFFEAFRNEHAATRYESLYSDSSFDVFNATLLYLFCALGFSFLILLPGFTLKDRASVAIRIFLSLFIGAAIIFSNYCMEWKTGSVETTVQYKASVNKEIRAEVVVNIGLRGIDVTMKGLTISSKEMIDYRENFCWNSPWSQGRVASQMSKEYYSALMKGTPYPILTVAEYFTMDGESLRWGRCFQLAGFYTHALLWLSFTLWLITNILFLNVITYGAYFLSLTGIVLLVANLLYHMLLCGPQLVIPFPEGHLEFTYGWCFWLCFTTGIVCIVLGSSIVILQRYLPERLASFFNIEKSIFVFEKNYLAEAECSELSSFVEIIVHNESADEERTADSPDWKNQRTEPNVPRTSSISRTQSSCVSRKNIVEEGENSGSFVNFSFDGELDLPRNE